MLSLFSFFFLSFLLHLETRLLGKLECDLYLIATHQTISIMSYQGPLWVRSEAETSWKAWLPGSAVKLKVILAACGTNNEPKDWNVSEVRFLDHHVKSFGVGVGTEYPIREVPPIGHAHTSASLPHQCDYHTKSSLVLLLWVCTQIMVRKSETQVGGPHMILSVSGSQPTTPFTSFILH